MSKRRMIKRIREVYYYLRFRLAMFSLYAAAPNDDFADACRMLLAAWKLESAVYMERLDKLRVSVNWSGLDGPQVAAFHPDGAVALYNQVDDFMGRVSPRALQLHIDVGGTGAVGFVVRVDDKRKTVMLSPSEFVHLMQVTLIPHFAKLTLDGDLQLQRFNPEEHT